MRLVKSKGDIMDLAGAWKDVSDEDIERMFKSFKEAWSKWKLVRE